MPRSAAAPSARWRRLRLSAALFWGVAGPLAAQAGEVTVFAAASLTDVIGELASQYQRQHPAVRIRTSFASSSTLAKQIEAGAPADLFVSADSKWMDYLQRRQRIDPATRRAVLGNALVLITPAAQPREVAMTPGVVPVFTGRLCLGDPAHVPAGRYARQALQTLGWWQTLAPRVVATEDVRTALAFVQRGECPLGVVYATDAIASAKVRIAGRFLTGTHDPVVYPFAAMPGASGEARAFLDFLQGNDAKAVFTRAGFTVLAP